MLLSPGIDAEEMSDEHLLLELKDIYQLATDISKGHVDYTLPALKTYAAGAGSTSFFYRRLKWIKDRHTRLFFTAVYRQLEQSYDFHPKSIWTPEIIKTAQEAGVWNDYGATQMDRLVSLQRLKKKLISLKNPRKK